MPIIDHMQAAREARQKIYGVRNSAAFREVAAAIQVKHGSRKSGIPMTGQKRNRKNKRPARKPDNGQLTLDIGFPDASNS